MTRRGRHTLAVLVCAAAGTADVAALASWAAPRALASASARPALVPALAPVPVQALGAPAAPATASAVTTVVVAAPPIATAPDARPRRAALIFFSPESSRIGAADAAHLARVAAEARLRPGLALVVVGHADASGSRSANDRLSRRRAEAVARALGAAGIEASRLQVSARGSAQARHPSRGPANSAAARAPDRRVEVDIVTGDETP